MATMIDRLYCETCKQETKAERRGANHVLHFLISLCTFWLWLPGWYYVAKSAPSNCTVCGSIVKQPSKMSAALPAVLIAWGWVFVIGSWAESCSKSSQESAEILRKAQEDLTSASQSLVAPQSTKPADGLIEGAELRSLSATILKVENQRIDEYGLWRAIATVHNTTARPLAPYVQVSCRLIAEDQTAIAVAEGFVSSDSSIQPGETLGTELVERLEVDKPITRVECNLQ